MRSLHAQPPDTIAPLAPTAPSIVSTGAYPSNTALRRAGSAGGCEAVQSLRAASNWGNLGSSHARPAARVAPPGFSGRRGRAPTHASSASEPRRWTMLNFARGLSEVARRCGTEADDRSETGARLPGGLHGQENTRRRRGGEEMAQVHGQVGEIGYDVLCSLFYRRGCSVHLI
ncbi:hypothetical protein C8Q78DRAFT_845041 [Trametes maxima]|nr:hypothetical protein C8Q78DRAFT_845041 [Trametes maxima]